MERRSFLTTPGFSLAGTGPPLVLALEFMEALGTAGSVARGIVR